MKPWVLPASAALHLAGLAALLPWSGEAGQPETPLVEVELVRQAELVGGGPPAVAPPVSAPPPILPDTADPPDPAPSTAELPTPPQPPDAEPAPRSSGRPRTAPRAAPSAVNLGNAEDAREGLDVTGRNVVPPAPDSRFRNQPPSYPAAAARAGAQGTVGLRVQVSASGVPTQVTVASSSGHAVLDGEARSAVRRWRFTPAQIQGTPVPFEYALDIRFILGDTP